MLDGLFALTHQIHKPVFDEKYHVDQAIVKATLVEVPHSKKLTVVFLAWHSPFWYERLLVKRLKKAGTNALIYTFNSSVLEGSVLNVKNSFEYIALSVSVDIKQLRLTKGYETINLLGISLGNVAMCMAAEKIERFSSVVMLVPGSDLADPFWYSWRTRRLREQQRHKGIALSVLEDAWSELAPTAHLETLKSHPVHIILARKDRFIPYRYGVRLLDALRAIDHRVVATRRPFGHLATILAYEPEA